MSSYSSSPRLTERSNSGSRYLVAFIAPFRPHGLIGKLQRTEYCIGVTSVAAIGAAISLATGSPFTALAIAAAPGLLYPHFLSDLHLAFNEACRKCGWDGNAILGLMFGMAIATAFLIGMAAPAHALFYSEAEKFMKDKVFTGVAGADTMISLTINVLRAIFVIYVGIAVISVVQKMQQGDDWQTAARIPLVVMLCATIGDKMSEMIVK